MSNFTDFAAAATNFQPAFSNLYEVRIQDGTEELSTYSKFFCEEVSFPEAGLTFNRDKGWQDFYLESVEPVSQVTIKWAERSDFPVRAYHESWFDLFWDKTNYCFVSATDTSPASLRYRSASITLFDDRDSPRMQLTLDDLLPTQIPELQLAWATASPISYSITYKLTNWSAKYGDDIDENALTVGVS